MREIKFRGKRFDNGEWIYGHLHVIDTLGEGYTGKAIQQQSGKSRPYSVRVHDESVGQYTGLKDKNGKEIYEGDIVKAWVDLGPAGEVQKVYEIGITPFGCNLQEWTFKLYGYLPKTIGNVHEHPHLLKEES